VLLGIALSLLFGGIRLIRHIGQELEL